MRLVAVIPAGGSGTRLWPRSRRATPKHTLEVGGGGPLLEAAYERARAVADEVYVLTEAAQVGSVKEVLQHLDESRLIIEPEARGTASALGLAAMTLVEREPGAVMLSTAADHMIQGEDLFAAAVSLAAQAAAAADVLVTIGLEPRFAATGYGYIRCGEAVFGAGARRVEAFVEKPDRARAEEFVKSRDYLWNLSMFCWRPAVFLDELAKTSPAHFEGLKEVVAARSAGDAEGASRAYGKLPNEAVDYAVLERAQNLVVVAAEFRWTDVGSWSEIWELLPHDERGNAVEGDAVLLDSEGCLVSSDSPLVAAVGLRDLLVVAAGDAVLVCPRDRAQDVKRVVEELKRSGRIGYV